MSDFGLISQIDAQNSTTWLGKVFVTFDIDWACDEVLEYCIDLVEAADVPATWFVTHDTKLLARLRKNQKFELGVHPNFNNLLSGAEASGKNAEDTLKDILKIVPEACSIRSHSLVQSERLVDMFIDHGLNYISNFYIPLAENSVLVPWRLWGGVTAVPHCWQDNVSMRVSGHITAPELSERRNILVLDFHPIHVFLNSDSVDRYEAARPYFLTPSSLVEFRNRRALGACDVLKGVLS